MYVHVCRRLLILAVACDHLLLFVSSPPPPPPSPSDFDCGPLISPANGKVDVTGTSVGSLATYSCNRGFQLAGGNEFRRCLNGIGWEGTAPSCEREFELIICSPNIFYDYSGPLYSGHLWDKVKVFCLEGCPHFRGELY